MTPTLRQRLSLLILTGVLIYQGVLPLAVVPLLILATFFGTWLGYMQGRFLGQGLDPATSTADEFAALIKSEIERWGKVIKQAGIRVEAR